MISLGSVSDLLAKEWLTMFTRRELSTIWPADHESTIDKVAEGKLGFFSLGYMGSRIAKRLLSAAYPLVVFNRNRAKADALDFAALRSLPAPGNLSPPPAPSWSADTLARTW
jgi:phosphoglycerate dehydrogenase-like enzyme